LSILAIWIVNIHNSNCEYPQLFADINNWYCCHCALVITTIGIVDIDKLNCQYFKFELFISTISCWYRQLELSISVIHECNKSIVDIENWYYCTYILISTIPIVHSNNSIVGISNSNCRYQQIMSITDIKYCTLQYINFVQYRQFKLSILTMQFADFDNLYCWYPQFKMFILTMSFKWRFRLPYW